jgi:hypothetical protein
MFQSVLVFNTRQDTLMGFEPQDNKILDKVFNNLSSETTLKYYQ